MRSLSRFSQTPWPGGVSEKRLLLIVPQQSGFQSIGRAGLIDLIGFEGWERLEW
jgi:hypothetical protein